MAEELKKNEASPGVHAHLSIMQAVIARMAEGSRSSKNWCITIVAAILVLGAGMTGFGNLWIAYVPLAMFLGLDMYYLSLERRFIASYNAFLRRLRSGEVAAADLYEVTPTGPPVASWAATVTSFFDLALLSRARRRDCCRPASRFRTWALAGLAASSPAPSGRPAPRPWRRPCRPSRAIGMRERVR